MTESLLKIGALVRGSYFPAGILCRREFEPEPDWIDEQLRSDQIKSLGKTDWWGVMPLDGGFALEPAQFLTYLRDTTYDDFLQAADMANAAGREALVRVFPHYVNRVLAERGLHKNS